MQVESVFTIGIKSTKGDIILNMTEPIPGGDGLDSLRQEFEGSELVTGPKAVVLRKAEDVRGPDGELPSNAAQREREKKSAPKSSASEPASRNDETLPIVEGILVEDGEPKKDEGVPLGRTGAAIAGAAAAVAVDEVVEQVADAVRKKVRERKGESVKGNREKEERQKAKESDVNSRSFTEIQNERKSLINRPDSVREQKLRTEVARVIIAAKDAGVLGSIAPRVSQLRTGPAFSVARAEIAKINPQRYEDEARGLSEWDDKFEGIIEEYKEITLLSFRLGELRANGQGSSREAVRLEREIDVRSWGSVPLAEIEARARVESEPSIPQEVVLKNQRELTPEQQRMMFLEIEDAGDKMLEIPPLTSVIWEGLKHDEKQLWQARLQLLNSRAYKQVSGEDLSKNKFLAGLNKEQLSLLMNHPGVNESVSMYTVFIVDPNFSESIKDSLGMDETRLVWADVEDGRGGKKTVGIDDERKLGTMRKQVRDYLAIRLGLNEEQARSAEQIAYNFVYVINLAEEVDHTGLPRNPKIINEGLRDIMHPRSKLLDAIDTGKVGDRWPPNVLGEWARFHRKRLIKHPEQIPLTDNLTVSFFTKEGVIGRGIQKIFNDDRRNIIISLDTKKKYGPNLKSYYLDQGKNFLTGRDFVKRFEWDDPVKVDETPFGRYLAVQIGRSSLVFEAIKTKDGRLPPGRTEESLQNTFRSLRLDSRTRETLLYLLYNPKLLFLNPHRRDFKPRGSRSSMDGFWDSVSRDYPGFFDDDRVTFWEGVGTKAKELKSKAKSAVSGAIRRIIRRS